ncbi:hypothetical protein GSI_14555 [Ganoderma sinense ZZ0214-1]|uniref:F-box domain-containing protein n=1 Tax=Ganoderma sinense ZZ0214-1 TaxID=1077348 RepID=A0A2G8RNZ8_9APHY|nr:hypothetical protein GSI_14555 [Ganoderma sinense ZZ0214-1]
MAPSQLNADVVAIVCDFLQVTDVSDVLSLALVSSSVRPIATRWLLRTCCVPLTSDTSIRKFHSFLFADAPARAPHVRALDINLEWPYFHQTEDHTGNVSLVLDILTSCSRIQHISIDLERALGHFGLSILRAIAAQKRLNSLNIVASVRTVIDLITEIRISCCPLRRITIHSNGYWFPDALEQFLPRIALTLEELEVYIFMVDQDYIQSSCGILTESVFTMTQYFAVRSLSTPSFHGQPLLDHFHHLFPALDTLHLGKLYNDSVREDAYPQVRTANQQAHVRSCVWKKLDLVDCDARMLYVLSLRCPIRRIMLDYCKMDEQRYAADALRENPVPHLKVTLGHGRTMVDELFTPELAGTLTHLTLCMSYYNYISIHSGPEGSCVPRLRWDDVLDKLVSTLRPLHKLTHLRIVFHAAVFVYSDAASPFAPPEEYALTLRGSTFDFDGTAASLVRPFPSLEYIFLTTCGVLSTWDDSNRHVRPMKPYERWHVPRAWRVAKPDTLGRTLQNEERVLVALHDEVAETVIRQEDLTLSQSDEEEIRKCVARG